MEINIKKIGKWIYDNGRLIKTAVIFTILMFGLLIYSYYIYHTYVQTIAIDKTPESSINYLNEVSNSEKILKESEMIRQEFFGDYMGISAMKLKLGNGKSGTLEVKLVQRTDNTVVKQWTKDLSKVKGDILTLKLDKKIENTNGVPYALEIKVSGSEDIKVYLSDQDVYQSGECMLNGELQSGDLLFQVVPVKQKYSVIKFEFWFFVFAMMAVIVCFAYALLRKKEVKLEWLFVIFMLVYGGIYLFILPPFSAPDEPSHYATAYHTSNRILGVKETDDKLVTCRACDNDWVLYITPNAESYRVVLKNLFRKTDNVENNTQFVLGERIEQAVLVAHLPQAIGITIARVFDFNYITSIYLAELCSLLFYIVMVFFAIRMIPVGKYMLFVLSGLPMMLQEAASCGYDIIVMGFVYFFIAYVLRFVYEEREIRLVDIVIITVLAILFSPCKLVYCVVPFLVVLIPLKAFKNKKCSIIAKIGIPFIGLLSAAICNMGSVAGSTGATNYIEWAGEEGYTVGYLMHHILKTISIFVATVHDYMGFYIGGLIGDNLGWFNTSIPLELTIASAILVVLSINNNEQAVQIRVRQKLLFFAIALCSSLMICASMLLAWTPISSKGIQGVQGRYFLPIIPLMLFCFTDKRKNNMYNRNIILIGSCMVNFLVVVRIFETVILR